MLAPLTAFDEDIYTRRGRSIKSPCSLVLYSFKRRGFQGSEGIKEPSVFCLGGSDQGHQCGRSPVWVVRGRRWSLLLPLKGPERQETGFVQSAMGRIGKGLCRSCDGILDRRQMFLCRTTGCTAKEIDNTRHNRVFAA